MDKLHLHEVGLAEYTTSSPSYESYNYNSIGTRTRVRAHTHIRVVSVYLIFISWLVILLLQDASVGISYICFVTSYYIFYFSKFLDLVLYVLGKKKKYDIYSHISLIIFTKIHKLAHIKMLVLEYVRPESAAYQVYSELHKIFPKSIKKGYTFCPNGLWTKLY